MTKKGDPFFKFVMKAKSMGWGDEETIRGLRMIGASDKQIYTALKKVGHSDSNRVRKYLNLNTREMIKKFVNDDSLGVLIHCAEHMALRKPPLTGIIDKEAQELIKK